MVGARSVINKTSPVVYLASRSGSTAAGYVGLCFSFDLYPYADAASSF